MIKEIYSIAMASNYTEYRASLSVQEQSTAYCEEKPENLLPRESTESGSNPVECEVSQVENLRRRRNRQNGRKPIECDQCGKCFSSSRNLNDHKRIHSGEKPFECDQCGKCFTQSGTLSGHERTQWRETF